jgi:hypothetical protein
MNAACARCGPAFEPEPGYHVGAMYVNYAATAVLGMTAGLLLLGRIDARWVAAGLMVFGGLFPVLFFRHARALWRAVDFYVESRTSQGIPTDRLPR